MKEVDARGLSCPIPVVKVKKTMEDDPKSAITVLVDEQTQVENVSRLAENKGYDVKQEALDDFYKLVLTPKK